MIRFVFLLIMLFIPGLCAAQSHAWTLDECVAYALEHNITIKQSELTAASKQISLSTAQWAYAPDISASSSYTLSTGRVLDPTTYDFIENELVGGSNTSVSASIAVFNGMRNMHNLKRARLDLRASLLDVQKMRNDVRLNVTALYLEILCAEENVRNAEQTIETLRLQEEKTAKLVEVRKVTAADLLQIQSELANAENTLFTARNTYDIARLNLCQLLEIEDYTSFNTVKPDDEIDLFFTQESGRILEAAQSLPEIESARLGVDIARRDLSLARSSYYPTLSLSAGYGSSYSDVRQKTFQNPDGTFRAEAYSFFEQYRDNASSNISIALNIPIFGRLSTRKQVAQQKLAISQAEYALQTIEKQVRREVIQAQIDANTAWEKYGSSQKFVESATEAARQMERKYNLGAATVLEYNTTLNALVEAQTQLLQSKYEYLFKVEIIRFYLEQ